MSKLVTAAVAGLTLCIGAQAADWKSTPLTLVWRSDPACKVIITSVSQDNGGQPIRIRYKNGSPTDREKFNVQIVVKRGGSNVYSGAIDVDNANPSEEGDRTSSPSFAGNIRTQGTTIQLTLGACSFNY